MNYRKLIVADQSYEVFCQDINFVPGLVERILVEVPPFTPPPPPRPPVIFIAGRPKAALLFWFFGDFRCGALLFMVINVIYKYKKGTNSR